MSGVASDQCVLVTAEMARMHGYDVTVPRDVVASQTAVTTQVMLNRRSIRGQASAGIDRRVSSIGVLLASVV